MSYFTLVTAPTKDHFICFCIFSASLHKNYFHYFLLFLHCTIIYKEDLSVYYLQAL